MSDTTSTTTDGTNGAQEGTQAPANSVQELPEWAQTTIKDLRAEAAQHRIEKNDAVEAARTALAAEYEEKLTAANAATEAVRNDLTQAQLETAKLNAALDADIPAKSVKKIAALLQGSTEAELRSHADELKALFGTTETQPPIDPSQGSGSSHVPPLNGDPLLNAVKAAVGSN